MNGFSLKYEYSNNDLVLALPKIQKALRASGFWVLFAIAAIVTFAVGMVANLLRPGPQPLLLAACTVVVVVAVVALVLVARAGRATVARHMDTLQPALPVRLEANDQGLEIVDAHSRLWWDWHYIRGIVDVPNGIAVLVGATGLFVPDTAFDSSSRRQDFIAYVGARATPPAR